MYLDIFLLIYNFYITRKLVIRANHIFHPVFRFTLLTIEEFIMMAGEQLPRDLVQNICNKLYAG
jgi:hypothetical protein